MDASQPDHIIRPFHSFPGDNITSAQDPSVFFSFLKTDEEKHSRDPSFFSENGLSQDIIQVTGAEPDICLEVFYALYHVLWPQIDKKPDISLKDAWTRFIGGSVFKGILCPPEKLITERRVRDLTRSFSEAAEGESQIFQDLDGVIHSILNLKKKIDGYSAEEISYKKEILATLDLVHDFYLRYRSQVKDLVQVILEKEQVNAASRQECDALEDLLEPKAIMMSDIWTNHWAYRISRNKARKLLSLDSSGRNIKSNLSDPSNHRVIALPEKVAEPLVFFKANGNPPIQPEKEFMLYSLYRHFQIPVPETGLLILTDVFETNRDYLYAVQASEAVLGESPLKAYRNEETVFEEEAYVFQTIGAFLTNPSDGSFKNFKYSPVYQTFISIDNDLVFKPELIGKDDKKIVNVKSMLYLLPQIDLPIPESIKTFFTSLDPHLTILSWLCDLSKKNREYSDLWAKLTFQKTRCEYQNLLPQSEVPSLVACLQQKVFVDPDLHTEAPFFPQILISQNLLNSLTEKLYAIEKVLLTNRPVSTQALLEEISPALGKYYRKLRQEFNDPEEALEALWGDKKNGVNYSYISSLLDHEELKDLLNNKDEICENLMPEEFFKGYKEKLTLEESRPLDRFIRRHNQRKKKNTLNFRLSLRELRLLIQEHLTDSQEIKDIVDFCHNISKMKTIESENYLVKEITFLLSKLPHSELKWLLTLENHFFRVDRDIPKDLMTSSVSLLGAYMKQRTLILTESEKNYLFDSQGNIRKNSSLTGRSSVTYFPEKNPEFYLKQYPEWPGYEFASSSLMRLLGIQHLPYQDLMIINSKYPVLLSQKVNGDPVHRVWSDTQAFKKLDPFHTGLLIISAMLINPEDGKEDNFILSKDGKYLIPIDNDHCFLPSTFQKEGNLWNAWTINTALQTKTLLFCLDEMTRLIPDKVRQHILSINFDLLLTSWMTELDRLENKFNNLVDQNQRNKFLEQGTVMRIPFYKQYIQSIHWKAHKIQNLLTAVSEITPFDLLRAIEPFAAKCYQDSFKGKNNLRERFQTATDRLYTKTLVDGSRVSILNTRRMMEIINISEKDLQNDSIYQRMGPFDCLEVLKKLIEERSEKIKKEQDFLCELDEKNHEKKWISLFGNSLVEKALKAFLANFGEGLELKGSRLITSNKLEELFAQIPNNRIRFLSLPNSPTLTEKEIRLIAIECPNLEYLNVSGCEKLRKIFTAKGEWPLLARLEANHCISLEKFVSYSPLKILRVESGSLTEMFVEESPVETFKILNRGISFEFSRRDFQMRYYGRILSHAELFNKIFDSQFGGYFRNFKMTIGKHSISTATDLLTTVSLPSYVKNIEDLKTIIMLRLLNLTTLDLSRNEIIGTGVGLRCLIQGNWPTLIELDLSYTGITDRGIRILTQGNWPSLETLRFRNTKITVVGLEIIVNTSKWTQIKHLDLSGNQISHKIFKILLQGNGPLLETLNLADTGIIMMKWFYFILNLKSSNLKAVEFSSSGKNFIEKLLQEDWQKLKEINFCLSEITENDIAFIVKKRYWPQLKVLDLSMNKGISDGVFEILARADWPLLEALFLMKTGITKKGVLIFLLKANWPNLQTLLFDWGERDFERSMLPKNWSLLEKLDLKDCNITNSEIKVIVTKSSWPQLKHLDLSSNKAINDEGFEILCHGGWPLLTTLDLNDTGITKKKLLYFVLNVKWPNLKKVKFDSSGRNFAEYLLQKDWHQLRILDLSRGEITLNEVELIVKKYNFPHFQFLSLSLNEIHDEGLEILVSSNWHLLGHLNLRKTGITNEGLEILTSKSNWPNLKTLDISWNRIQNEGLKTLIHGKWPLLEGLFLCGLEVTEKGIESIANLSEWSNFKILDISFNRDISNQGLENLVLGKWPKLESLYLRGLQVEFKDFENFANKSSWPNLKKIYFEEHYGDYDDEKRNTLKILISEKWPSLELNIEDWRKSFIRK